jgi:hypothetical protein
MGGYYDNGFCNCDYVDTTVKVNGGLYNHYKNHCVCPTTEVYLPLKDLEGDDVPGYPVDVYNVNEEMIGVANNKNQYITVWNSDPDNQLIGTLENLIGPMSFKLKLNRGQTAPPYVIGVYTGVVEEQNVYSIVYSNIYY